MANVLYWHKLEDSTALAETGQNPYPGGTFATTAMKWGNGLIPNPDGSMQPQVVDVWTGVARQVRSKFKQTEEKEASQANSDP